MVADSERVERIRQIICQAGWDALICALPSNVLMLTGYWPVIGTSIAIFTSEGRIGLVVPEDEHELARRGWADELSTFQAGLLDEITTASKRVGKPLARVAKNLKIGKKVGFESGAFSEPATYAGMHFYGGALPKIISEALPGADSFQRTTNL